MPACSCAVTPAEAAALLELRQECQVTLCLQQSIQAHKPATAVDIALLVLPLAQLMAEEDSSSGSGR